MSTSTLATVRAAVDNGIASNLPATWRRITHLAAAQAATVPVLYTEFTGINTEAKGQRLPQGNVFCDFDLVIVVPETDDRKAEGKVDAAVLDLIIALDAADTSLVWDTAKKERLTSGQLAWRVSLSVITSTRK